MSSNVKLRLIPYLFHNISNDSSQATCDNSTFDDSSNADILLYDKTTSESEIHYHDDYPYRQSSLRRRPRPTRRESPPKRSSYHHIPTSTFRDDGDRSFDDSSDDDDDFQPKSLSMIGEEISPIRMENSENMPPPCAPLSIPKVMAFRPQHTSSKMTLPRTNPMHVANTPRGGSLMRTTRRDQPRPRSGHYAMGLEKRYNLECSPDMAIHYGVVPLLAKQMGLTGHLNLGISINYERVKVTVCDADYFLDRSIPQVSSKIEISLKPKGKAAGKRLHSAQTIVKSTTNQPIFNEQLRLHISDRNFKDNYRLAVRCLVQQPYEDSWTQLGCMAFSLRRLMSKRDRGDHSECEGYFLLKSEKGEENHFAAKKIRHTKYYPSEDISCGTTSSSVSMRSCSPVHQMIRNENEIAWTRHHQGHHHRIQQLAAAHGPNGATVLPVPQYPHHQIPSCGSAPGGGLLEPMYAHYQPRHLNHRQNIPATSSRGVHALLPCSQPPLLNIPNAAGGGNQQHRNNYLDSETSGSSNNSLDEPGNVYHGRHRYTLPSISTTSDSCSEFSAELSVPSRNLDMDKLYAPMPEGCIAEEPSTSKEIENVQKDHSTVRRVASFTFSPQGASDKHNKRVVDEKKTKASITKKISSFFSKELTSSTSQLHPSQEEVRSWGQSLEHLLKHKAGFLHLKQFMQSQRCDENIDFWKECEEYKKMKEGKKAQQKAHQIFDEFVSETALRQVNLEAEVRKATQASYESGPKPDTFSLAQTKIELLMSQGPYSAFLQSQTYLNLVKSHSDDAKSSHSS